MNDLTGPELLRIPPKLLPVLTDFNKYKYFLLEGGRGSSKTQTIARILLYIAEKRNVRIFCGREVQNTIEESVHAVLSDLITEHELAYKVQKVDIAHVVSKSVFKFKGFREQGSVNIKGIEGADIIWIDEAQSITKPTLDVIIPTVRKNNAKLIFTMNRFMRDDAVVEELSGREDCLHIKINYFENPFCPQTLKIEAELSKAKSEKDYNHIWLGLPLATAGDYLFDTDKLYAAFTIKPFGELFKRQRILSIDMAGEGDDQCVATVLDRRSNQHWQVIDRIPWDEPDTMVSVGKIVNFMGIYRPDITIIDKGGLGKPVWDRLNELPGIKVYAFDGGSTEGVDKKNYANARAQGYFTLKEWFDNGWMCVDEDDKEIIKQLEKIKFKYRSNGVRIIQSKKDMKKELRYSPDDADSLMMAVWAAITILGRASNNNDDNSHIMRKTGSNRRK